MKTAEDTESGISTLQDGTTKNIETSDNVQVNKSVIFFSRKSPIIENTSLRMDIRTGQVKLLHMGSDNHRYGDNHAAWKKEITI